MAVQKTEIEAMQAVAPNPLESGAADLPPKPKGIGVQRAFQVLAANLTNFETRKEQFELTQAIAKSLETGQHLVAEAPTGTGKSFAVTLGVIANSMQEAHGGRFRNVGKRAVIATANNNLLEQYATKDLPFLQTMFPGLTWARAKGKNNYACLDKGEKLFNQMVLFDQGEPLKRLKDWYDTTETGDKETINFSVKDEDWRKINADDTCTGQKCPFYSQCHYYKAKEELQSAHIIVTNFDLVLLELFNPAIQIFPRFDYLIFDEAHQLEEKAISKLEESLTERQIVNYIVKAEREFGMTDRATINTFNTPVMALFQAYRGLLAQGEEKKSIVPNDVLIEKTMDFADAMLRLRKEIAKFKTHPDSREAKAQLNLMESCTNAARAAKSVITNDKKSVSWVEVTKSDIKVVTCPFRVQQYLHKTLFTDPSQVVVTLSATLAAGGKSPQLQTTAAGFKPVAVFEQFRQRIGMILAGEFLCDSPFDYRRNCVLYLPKPPEEMKDPKDARWDGWMKQECLQLVEMSQGRALILTTSSKATKDLGQFLSAHTRFPVKTQGPDMPNSKLIEWFKETNNAILIGTASFWEGVSIEGDDLKLVIIDKLPFTPHTEPIQQAREAWYKSDPNRHKKAFMDLQLFPAIIRLKQGFGRLIRTKTDTGAVAILDPRLTTARYRGVILGSLPKAYKADRIDDPRLVNVLK